MYQWSNGHASVIPDFIRGDEDSPVLSGQLPAEIREKQGKEEKDTGKHGDPLVESSQISLAS